MSFDPQRPVKFTCGTRSLLFYPRSVLPRDVVSGLRVLHQLMPAVQSFDGRIGVDGSVVVFVRRSYVDAGSLRVSREGVLLGVDDALTQASHLGTALDGRRPNCRIT